MCDCTEECQYAGYFHRRELPFLLRAFRANRPIEVDMINDVAIKHAQDRKDYMNDQGLSGYVGNYLDPSVKFDSILFSSPNRSEIFLAEVKADMFTTTDYALEFQDGMLVSYKAERPSEIASFLTLPAKLIRSYLSGIAEIISLKVDYTNQAKSYAEAQIALIDAEVARQQAIEDAAAAQDN